jgi:acyl-CoA thioesterase-1
MKISIITDSLSLGRIDYNKNNKDNVTIFHYETWPNLLKFDNVYVNSKRERTTEFLLTDECKYECIDLVNPNTIIIQIGVVDCAPRVISRTEKKLMNKWFFPKFIRNHIIKNRSKNRSKLTQNYPLSKVYVDESKFINNLEDFIKQNQNIQIVIIPIVYDIINLDKSFVLNCMLYNNNIYDLCQYYYNCSLVNIDNMVHNDLYFCKDGYHLSIEGHKELANKLHEILN